MWKKSTCATWRSFRCPPDESAAELPVVGSVGSKRWPTANGSRSAAALGAVCLRNASESTRRSAGLRATVRRRGRAVRSSMPLTHSLLPTSRLIPAPTATASSVWRRTSTHGAATGIPPATTPFHPSECPLQPGPIVPLQRLWLPRLPGGVKAGRGCLWRCDRSD